MPDPLSLLPPVFAEACRRGRHASRYDLTRPILRDGWAYATDGQVAVRTPATPALVDAFGAAAAPKAPDVSAVFGQPPGTYGPPVPLPSLAGLPPCPECGGSGFYAPLLVVGPPGDVAAASDLLEENGFGAFAAALRNAAGADLGRLVTLFDGEESPDLFDRLTGGPCDECDGAGVADEPRRRLPVANGYDLTARYVALLARHGFATARVPLAPCTATLATPLRFDSADGAVEGRLMPLVPAEEVADA